MTGNNVLDLLDYKLKYFLQNTLGWTDLTDIQKETIPVILNDENSLIIAPTASGKTEAALIPIYNNLITKSLSATSVLYIAPLKALINDMDKRVYTWNQYFGFTATKWHGDASKSKKDTYLKKPSDILLTTPESLEVILINKSENQKKKIFENIKYVIIDEIHYFIESDRGIQLNSLLKRITEYSKDFVKIGLSATVGNPDIVAEWIDYKNPAKIIKTSRKPVIKYKIQDYNKNIEVAQNLEKYINHKVLLFCTSRHNVEEFAKIFNDNIKSNIYLHHSSINKDIREKNEDLFKNMDNAFMISTTTLELGIDIGNIDLVSMIKPPTTMSSFIQKIGRSGRKSKTERALLFTSDNQDSLKYLAQMNLSYMNIVENINIRKKALDLYLHQILSIIFQKTEVKVPDLYYFLNDTFVFKDISKDSYKELIKHLFDAKILDLIDSKLSLGYEFEKIFGKRNFLNFYSVFSTSTTFTIKHGRIEIGELDLLYTFGLKEKEKFILGGKYWQIEEIDYNKMTIYVTETSKTEQIPRWNSGGDSESYLIWREIYNILLDDYDKSLFDKFEDEFKSYLKNLIEYTKEFNLDKNIIPVSYRYDKNNLQVISIYTFAGRKVNHLLTYMILDLFEVNNIYEDNYQIKITSKNDIAEDIIKFFNDMTEENINEEMEIFLDNVEIKRFQTKFSPYLPEEQQEMVVKELVFDFNDLKDLTTYTKMEVISGLEFEKLIEDKTPSLQVDIEDNGDNEYNFDININIDYDTGNIEFSSNNDNSTNRNVLDYTIEPEENDYDNITPQTLNNKLNLIQNDDDIKVEDVINSLIGHRYIVNNQEDENSTYDNDIQNIFDNIEDYIEIESEDNNEEEIKKVLVNSASEDELLKLPGFHLVNAKKVIKLREKKQYLQSFNDLKDKIGIDSQYFDQLKDVVIFNKIKSNTIDTPNYGRRLDI